MVTVGESEDETPPLTPTLLKLSPLPTDERLRLMLPPLKPGEHVLNLHGAQCSENADGTIEKGFETEVTYYLDVRPKRRPHRK